MSNSVPQTAGQTPPVSDQPIAAVGAASDAAKERAKQVFEHANRSLEKRNYEYAHDLFAQCVAADPSVLVYVQHFRANLAQMHPELSQPGAAKKAGVLSMRNLSSGGRGPVAKAAAKGEWAAALAAGCEVLKKSPADTATLCEMAAVCGGLGHAGVQLYYLRWAMDLAPAEVEINRRAAAVLEHLNEFDQAIGCWARVLQANPADEEAKKAVARLSVEKTIDDGGYDPAMLSPTEGDIAVPSPATVAAIAARNPANAINIEPPPLPTESTTTESAEEAEARLRAAIDADPNNPAPFVEFARFCEAESRLQDAERLYRRALEVAGGDDLELVVKLEEVYLRRMRERSAEATRRAEKSPTEETTERARAAFAEANRAEVEVYTARAARAPDDVRLQYELGIRLKRVGRYREAVQPLQAARADEDRLASTHLHLGECFQQISQHRLAMKSYRESLAACGAEWDDLRKLACYRAGALAFGLKDWDSAEMLLTELAAADFGYRDVADRLDKLAKIRETT